jgi:hypothetical protein
MISVVLKPISLVIGLFFAFSPLIYANKPMPADSTNKEFCLEITGLVLRKGKPINDATIRLIYENEVILTSTIQNKPKFRYRLRKDCIYTIEFSKEGCVTRLVSISTKIPQGISTDPIFRFDFDVELFEPAQNNNSDMLDFPTAIISYDKTKGEFDYDRNYTNFIKNSIKK